MATTTIMSVLDNEMTTVLEKHLANHQIESACNAIRDNNAILQANSSEVVATIMRHVTQKNLDEHPETFVTCEQLLIQIASTCNVEDVVFELINLVETTRNAHVFVTALKGMQVLIKRAAATRKENTNTLEWCLNAILTYVAELPLPSHVRENADGDAAEHLYEDNDQVRSIINTYITIGMFYGDLRLDEDDSTTDNRQREATGQRIGLRSRKTLLASFLLQLLGAPLYYLNMKRPAACADKQRPSTQLAHADRGEGSTTNTYTWQCASSIAQHLLRLYPDPVFLLAYVERRKRWPAPSAKSATVTQLTDLRNQPAEGVSAPQKHDVFASAEKTPTLCVAMLFYLLYVEELNAADQPKIYSGLYLLEGTLYLLVEMLATNEHALHAKALRLADVMLRRSFDADADLPDAESNRIPCDSLGLHVHEQFCTQLCRVITESPCRQNSQHGAQILQRYVMCFDVAGRWAVLVNLLRTVQHGGLCGHLMAIYKNMVAAALRRHEEKRLPPQLSGVHFRAMLRRMCRLEEGAATDLLKHSDELVTALNVLHFLALGDQSNRTGFWTLVGEVQTTFLEPLRRGIELTRSHYGLEERRVVCGEDVEKNGAEIQLSVEAASGAGPIGGLIDREAKLKLLRSAMTTFDLMESLLASVERSIRSLPKM